MASEGSSTPSDTTNISSSPSTQSINAAATAQDVHVELSGPCPCPLSALGPGGIMITERFVTDSWWPANLRLDLRKDNWDEWSRQMSLFALSRGFTKWLDGSLQRPDKAAYPEAHDIWQRSDRSLRAFMLKHASKSDRKAVSHLQDSHTVFKALRIRHEDPGLHTQVALFKKAFDMRYSTDTPLCRTAHELMNLATKIVNMGTLDVDRLICIFLYNALEDFKPIQLVIKVMAYLPDFSSKTILRLLGPPIESTNEITTITTVATKVGTIDLDNLKRILLINAFGVGYDFEDIRFSIMNIIDTPGISSDRILRLLEQEDLLNRLRAERRPRPVSSAIVTATKLTCSNCKRVNHTKDFCIRPGGKMAGRSLAEARAAERGNVGRNQTTKPATSAPLANVGAYSINRSRPPSK
jgi:hypothetical protein